MKPLIAGIAVAAVAASASPATAATPWSPPRLIGDPPAYVTGLTPLPSGGVALGGTTGITLMKTPDGAERIIPPVAVSALISADGQPGPLASLGTGQSSIEQVLPRRDGSVTVIGQAGATNRLVSATGRPGARLGPTSSLHAANGVAFDAAGDAVLVSRISRGGDRTDLAIVRRRGDGWSTPRPITRRGGTVGGGAITTLPDRELAIAYGRDGAIFVRRLAPSGRLSPAQRIGAGTASKITIARSGPHRLIVVWSSQHASQGDAASGFHVRAACSTASGHFGARARSLAAIPVRGPGRYVEGTGIELATDAAGTHTLAWTDYAGGRFVARTGAIDDACRVTPQTIAIPDTDVILGGLSVAPSGAATIAIIAGRRGADPPVIGSGLPEAVHGALAARRATSGAAFSAPVQVSAPADEDAYDVAVATDVASGRSVLTWRGAGTTSQISSAP
jgi:hypothetical protein